MSTSAQLRYRDGLPGHWSHQSSGRRIAPSSLALLLLLGAAGSLGALRLVLHFYPLG